MIWFFSKSKTGLYLVFMIIFSQNGILTVAFPEVIENVVLTKYILKYFCLYLSRYPGGTLYVSVWVLFVFHVKLIKKTL